jgi:hypothetical protein
MDRDFSLIFFALEEIPASEEAEHSSSPGLYTHGLSEAYRTCVRGSELKMTTGFYQLFLTMAPLPHLLKKCLSTWIDWKISHIDGLLAL